MNEVVQASVIENIGDGPIECQIVVAGDGFAVVGQGTVEKVVKGKGKKRGRYRKIDDLMVRAATVLVAHGFRPLQLMRLFGLARRTAYRLEKTAREEIERQVAASERKRQERERIKEVSLREYQEQERAQERISSASLREGWEGDPRSTEAEATTKEGYSLRSGIRRYRS